MTEPNSEASRNDESELAAVQRARNSGQPVDAIEVPNAHAGLTDDIVKADTSIDLTIDEKSAPKSLRVTRDDWRGEEPVGYEIGPLIGRGGMGEVYEARQIHADRKVAIKTLLTDCGSDHRRRLLAEVQATARLKHENIVTVYEVDDASALPGSRWSMSVEGRWRID